MSSLAPNGAWHGCSVGGKPRRLWRAGCWAVLEELLVSKSHFLRGQQTAPDCQSCLGWKQGPKGLDRTEVP